MSIGRSPTGTRTAKRITMQGLIKWGYICRDFFLAASVGDRYKKEVWAQMLWQEIGPRG